MRSHVYAFGIRDLLEVRVLSNLSDSLFVGCDIDVITLIDSLPLCSQAGKSVTSAKQPEYLIDGSCAAREM